MNTRYAVTPTDSRDVPRGTQHADLADFAHAHACARTVDDEPDDPVAAAIVCMAWLFFLVVVIVGAGAWPHIRAWWAGL